MVYSPKREPAFKSRRITSQEQRGRFDSSPPHLTHKLVAESSARSVNVEKSIQRKHARCADED